MAGRRWKQDIQGAGGHRAGRRGLEVAELVLGYNCALMDRCRGHVHGAGLGSLVERSGPSPLIDPHPRPPSQHSHPASSLCVQVRPSQPSRQMQEKESPLPTQVPPFMQGLGRQLLFLAVRGRRKRICSSGGLHIVAPTQPEAERAWGRGRHAWHVCGGGASTCCSPLPTRPPQGFLTDVASAALPARRAGTAEGVAAVIARATIAASVGVTLGLACGHTGCSGGVPQSSRQVPPPPTQAAGTHSTHVSSRSCPSSHHHMHNRSRSPGRSSGRDCGRDQEGSRWYLGARMPVNRGPQAFREGFQEEAPALG